MAVEPERGVVRASDAIGVARGRGDVEDDALRFDGGDRSSAPVGAAAQDETRADGQRAERQRFCFKRGRRRFVFGRGMPDSVPRNRKVKAAGRGFVCLYVRRPLFIRAQVCFARLQTSSGESSNGRSGCAEERSRLTA